MLTRLGQMSMESAFGHGHTIDVSTVVESDCPIRGLIVEEFDRVEIDGTGYGILHIQGVTHAELKFAMQNGVDVLLNKLQRAGVYPHTSIHRVSSVDLAV